MHIAIFHERFVFRFGVDRVLLCLAAEFRKIGHRVTLVGQRFDDRWLENSHDAIVELPAFEPYAESDIRAARWLQANWSRIFLPDNKIDAALVAGWPFFQTVAFLKTQGVPTWFQDHGIAPEDGFDEGHKRTIALLRDLKSRFVCLADGITPVSDFIARSQSNLVARPEQSIVVVRNGVDHASFKGLSSDDISQPSPQAKLNIFSVGRFEPGCYKQSEQVFDFARKLKQQSLDFLIGVLAPQDLAVPKDLEGHIVATGYLSDEELFRRTLEADVCVCFSRWEGFNLGLAESQTLGTACLVYNCGAHPEVVADSWLLCRTLDDFVTKVCALVEGDAPSNVASGACFRDYAHSRKWQHSAKRLVDLFERPIAARDHQHFKFFDRRNTLLIEVGNASRDPANSGVVRVTRQLASRLNATNSLIFVCWDEQFGDLRFPTLQELERLSTYGGPATHAWQPVSKSADNPSFPWDYLSPSEGLEGWLLLPEIKPPEAIIYMRSQAQRWGLSTAAIFYDAIAVVRPDLVQDAKYRDPHLRYMLALAECDVVIPISRASEDDLRRIWYENGLQGNVRTVLLPGGFQGERPAATEGISQEKIALCVSTVEPRKNHRRLIEAFRSYKAATPTSTLKLVLVGNRYAGAEDLAAFVESSVADDLEWRGIVSDQELEELYRKSAFTIYPSEIEGFGLPILESLWYGIPCLCHSGGVMAELAAEGGCLTADVTSLEVLADMVARMDNDESLRKTLACQAAARELKTWTHYAQEFMGTLCLARNIDRGQRDSDPVRDFSDTVSSAPEDWRTIVFGDCLHEGWQMSESEKAGLMAIVRSRKPKLAIEIGTYKGGSLSLIRQHAEKVISIDTDPSIREHFAYMDNVTFLTGDSKQLLPLLLAELEAHAISPDFVLIDGDHSASGVKADIECVLQMRPRRTSFIILHDMANEVCRSGALSVDWERYPHVQHVDLDFVPGRLIENGSPFDGQVWGGLGLIVLTSVVRNWPLNQVESCKRTLTHLWQAQALAH